MEDEIEPLNSDISSMNSQKEALSEDVADIAIEIDQCKDTLVKLEEEKNEFENDLAEVQQMTGVAVSVLL